MSKKHLLLLFVLFFCQLSIGQEKPPVKDSARMYKKIQEYSEKRGFTKFLHKLVFEPVEVKKKIAKVKPRRIQKRNFKAYEGKIIRNINVVTLDPFGFSEKDTTAKPKNSLSKFGNKVHLKSKALTIKNLILLRKNRPLDSLLVKESERLVRAQRFVRGVVITPVLISKKSDSVDIEIRELDSWSLIPDFSGSNTHGDFELTERNFLGLGHQSENLYLRDFETGEDAFSTRYTIPNIMNTYVKTSLVYELDLEHNYSKELNIERPFFSPFTRWAAGAYFDQQFQSDTIPDVNNVYARQNWKYNSQDFWAGHSYQIFRNNTEDERTTNLINTVRYLNINYIESPTAAYDSINFYADEKFFLTGIGISSRQFVEDKYLFNYGIIEDVPVGRVFGLTGGWQEKNNNGRLYAGARVALGKYYKWGYLSSNFEYGTFFNHSVSEQSAFSIGSNYFTNLQELGKWKLRQFVKAILVLGNNRLPSRGDQLTINDRNGIPGFDSVELYGTKKFVIGFQTQAYSPWNLAGFRLNPYLSFNLALLGNSETGFKNSPAYMQIGGGFIITNDYLVFSSFQLSLAYYPNIPGVGSGIFKTNAFSTEDFGMQDFNFAKPATVYYK
jgi:hypothetical protein